MGARLENPASDEPPEPDQLAETFATSRSAHSRRPSEPKLPGGVGTPDENAAISESTD